jgi:hypothetical protein
MHCRDGSRNGRWLWLAEKSEFWGDRSGIGDHLVWTVTQVVIPHFRPGGVESVPRYAYLGNSLTEILLNLVVQPQRVCLIDHWGERGLSVLLFLPIAWGTVSALSGSPDSDRSYPSDQLASPLPALRKI